MRESFFFFSRFVFHFTFFHSPSLDNQLAPKPSPPKKNDNRPRYIESLLEKAEKRKREEEIAKERR